jgi:hypothetical protein
MAARIEGSHCGKAILRGSLGFAVVSLAGFAVWAFAGRWFYRNVGEAGLYAASTLVFLGMAGLFLNPLVSGVNRMLRFYKAFAPAFLAYAVVWSICWFALKSGAGEWLGSLAGCTVFAWILGKMLGSTSGFMKVLLVLFIGHSAGYFLGGVFYMSKVNPEFLSALSKRQLALLGQMLWGLLYGLGFGAGIGFAFSVFQQAAKSKES